MSDKPEYNVTFTAEDGLPVEASGSARTFTREGAERSAARKAAAENQTVDLKIADEVVGSATLRLDPLTGDVLADITTPLASIATEGFRAVAHMHGGVLHHVLDRSGVMGPCPCSLAFDHDLMGLALSHPSPNPKGTT